MISIVEEFYKSIRFAMKDLIIFPGSNLKDILKFSILIALVSTVAYYFTPINLLHPVGAWIGVLVLAVSYNLGGAKDNAEADNGRAHNDGEGNAEIRETGTDK